ncbi:hypothetical protein [Pseudarthrobacter siccitolerans]|nr:hypothetical protein [Pseudarthrobacter siccitolerans]
MSTTGALWHDEATVDAGTVTTGSLVLLVGGQPEVYSFDALSTGNLTPGRTVRAPLTITNGGSTDMTYGLRSVVASAVNPADQVLVSALRLAVTADTVCGELPAEDPFLGPVPLDETASFAGRKLEPLQAETLCMEITLAADAPIAAAAGTTAVTFTFRGDQTS